MRYINVVNRTVVAYSVLINLFTACGSNNSTSSDVMYGALNGGTSSSYLNGFLNVQQNKKIGICSSTGNGLMVNLLANSVETWAQTLGRDGLVERINTPCNQSSTTQYARIVVGYQGGKSCGPNTLGAHSTSSDGRIHYITICRSDLNASKGTMLHEIGHAFGLCDQYGKNSPFPSGVNHPNCFSSGKNTAADIRGEKANYYSIMGNKSQQLIDDDIQGIRILSCFNAIAGNREWALINASLIQTWKQSAFFVSEIKRLTALGNKFVPQCL